MHRSIESNIVRAALGLIHETDRRLFDSRKLGESVEAAHALLFNASDRVLCIDPMNPYVGAAGRAMHARYSTAWRDALGLCTCGDCGGPFYERDNRFTDPARGALCNECAARTGCAERCAQCGEIWHARDLVTVVEPFTMRPFWNAPAVPTDKYYSQCPDCSTGHARAC